MYGLKLPKIMKDIDELIGNFDHAIFLFIVEALFLVKSRNWADTEISKLILNACIGETIRKMFSTREKLALGQTGWRPYRVW